MEVRFEAVVEQRDLSLQPLHAADRPAHLLALRHPPVDDMVHNGFGRAAEIRQGYPRPASLPCKLAAIPGIGPITASALVATVGDAKPFANGRQLAAWMGLVPRHCGST
jgi:transposase